MSKIPVSPLLVLPLLLLTGCATGALWEEDRFARFHEPVEPANLRLFRAEEDVLVQYTETRESDGKRRQRTYWLHRNEQRINEHRKPQRALPAFWFSRRATG